ncbi:MAG: glycosyltransferase [Planctomycetota bacterium]|nr:glycosyltransferase [Planctomycetota bacterium]
MADGQPVESDPGSVDGHARNGHVGTNGNAITGTKTWAPIRPKKVLFFGKTKARTRCTAALVDALEQNGVEVKWLNCSFLKRYFTKPGMRFLVRHICKRYDPDLLFVFYHDLPRELMKEFSKEIPTVVWQEEPFEIRDWQVDYVRDARLLCMSTPRLVREYRERGIGNATFLLSGYSPAFHGPADIPRPIEYDREIAFIGGPGIMGENRPEFLAWLSEHYDVEVFGIIKSWLPTLHKFPGLRFGREIGPSEYGQICARSKIVLGLNQNHENAYYFSNRIFLTLACRGFHLIRYVPGTEDLFEDGKHLAWFKSKQECLDKVDYYLEHEDQRLEIAAEGCELVTKQHRYQDRVADILAILSGTSQLECPDDPVSPSLIFNPFSEDCATGDKARDGESLRQISGS